MIRNTLDDALISRSILIEYLDFLINRINVQSEEVSAAFTALSFASAEYTEDKLKEHLNDADKFKAILNQVKNEIIKSLEKYDSYIPYYREEEYNKNLREHLNFLKTNISKLFK